LTGGLALAEDRLTTKEGARMSTIDAAAADRELKDRHRKMWALGDYPSIAREMVRPLAERLVEAAAIQPGQRVLDVGAGTGNAAIVAAQRGAHVVASDLTPELFDEGQVRASELGVQLDWVQADAEALPFEDESFDVVMSCIGAMFAPRHEATAAELIRVCKPGGTIAMANWTPEGLIGDLFRTMGPFMPAPPPGATPPPKWGSEDHIRELFGDAVTDLHMGRHMLPVTYFEKPIEYREYFKERYGPTIVAYRNVAGDPERTRELDEAFGALAERANQGAPGENARFEQEYLIVVARRKV
jgi:ubiquinone/menaquinone biosynthesis C-methylase UbiE